MTQNKKENFPYLPHTDKDREAMLEKMGFKCFEDLLAHIPEEIRVKELQIAPGLSELELSEKLKSLAAKNKSCSQQASFLGAGSYRRFVPAAVQSIVSRSEFATAYTPYQPEVSQGTLQAIYEFQTAVCLLTGMDLANASVYDGPTACAEGALMAARITDRNKVYAARTLNPEYMQVTSSYLQTCGLELAVLGEPTSAKLKASDLDFADAACLLVQYPNFLGCLEDLDELSEKLHSQGALLVVVADPINLGLLEAPGSFGADIVVGDAQQCGNGLSFGGPSAGFMACRSQFVRQIPGRLCGMTVDKQGRQAFTLTLQTREQHIRRAKATSNICTNQSLNALTMLVYLTLIGPKGLKDLAEIGMLRAHYLQEELCKIQGIKLKFADSFVNEFLLEFDMPVDELLSALKAKGILGGLNPVKYLPELKNCLLIACTEMTSIAEINSYIEAVKEIFGQTKGEKQESKLQAAVN